MELPSFADSEFALGHCARCEREVLTHVDYTDDGERLLCVHCDGPIGETVRPVKGADLLAEGYGAVEEAGGCGSGGCGSGACSRS
jgi:hypothetical protein